MNQMGGALMALMGGTAIAKQVNASRETYMLKNTGLQGSTFSGPRMTMGFDPPKPSTHSPPQKGRDHRPPKAHFE